jgi:hypothetical protein
LRYDVIIFDGCAPTTLEEGSVLLLGDLPPVLGVRRTGEAEKPALIDQAVHPVNLSLDYGNLYIQKALKAEWPKRALTLLEGDQGPLITAYTHGRLNLISVAFDLRQSDWPLRVSFPLFIANAVKYLSESSAPPGAGAIKVGQPIIVYPRDQETVMRIQAPGKAKPQEMDVYTDRRNRFTATYVAGLYRGTLKGSGEESVYAVNMVSAAESDNTARDAVVLGSKEVEAKSETAVINQEIWKWFALLGLGIVLVEWYIYNRKTYL